MDYYEIINSEAFISWFGNWKLAYETAGLDFKHPAWKNVSKAVDGNGMPEVVFHGTTHEWTKYSRKLGNHENDMGIGFYATSDKGDAELNYLKEGSDITAKTSFYAENLAEKQKISQSKARKIIESKFVGDTEKIMEVFLKLKRPVIITTKGFEGTYFDFSPSFNNDEYTDSKDLVKFKEAFDDVCDDFDLPYDVKDRTFGEFMDNIGELDYTSAYTIIKAIKGIESVYDYLYNEELGGNNVYEFVSQIFQKLRFDGVIYTDASEHFPSLNMRKGTRHFVAFKPNQIKLADGTNTTFNPHSNDIRFDDGGEVPENSNFEDSEKSRNFTNNTTKNDIRHIISGTHKVSYGANIQAAASYIRESKGASSSSESSGLPKEKEDALLKKYITDNNLWYLTQLPQPFGRGFEQIVYLIDEKYVVKTNNRVAFDSWLDYFNNLLLNNHFFPQNAYELLGFKEENGKLLAVVKQLYVEVTEETDMEFLKYFLLEKGFESIRNNNYENFDLGIIVKDLHRENVLTENGILQFIDTDFYLSQDIKLKDGGLISSNENFKKWFENSKVSVNGKPLIVYHGTNKEFYEFSKDKVGSRFGVDEEGFYFTDKETANWYAKDGVLLPVYLSLQNPLIVKIKEPVSVIDEWDRSQGAYFKDLKKGQDGIILIGIDRYSEETDKNLYVALEPTQIKLADGSNTTFDGSNPDIRFDDGGKVPNNPNFEDSEKSRNFTNNTTKDEIQHIISGISSVTKGTAIQTASSYLRGIKGSDTLAESQESIKTKEASSLKRYAISNNLWISSIEFEKVGEGYEQEVYFYDEKTVIKINSAIYYDSWLDYFNSLLLHNLFFPNTAYELIGFIQNNGYLLSVVKQPLVKATDITDLEFVKKFLLQKGFVNTKDYDYYNAELGITLQDLHDQNILTKNGVLYFIDTVFYIKKTNADVMLNDGGLVAPNGKKSNLTPEQYRLVRTPAFKKWFGDWENSPETASKVVDENGEPLVVYRSSPKKLGNIFKYVNLWGEGRLKNIFAFYFTPDKYVTEGYQKSLSEYGHKNYEIKSYFLNVRKILNAYDKSINEEKGLMWMSEGMILKKIGLDNDWFRKNINNKKEDWLLNRLEYTFGIFAGFEGEENRQKYWKKILTDKNYDGVLFYEDSHATDISKTYGVFEPNNIKLATGENVTFDGGNPDIRFNYGGELGDSVTSRFNLPIPKYLNDIESGVDEIISQYANRKMASIQVHAYLNENKDLGLEFIKSHNLTNIHELNKYLNNRQSILRKPILQQRKVEANEFEEVKTQINTDAIVKMAIEQGEEMDKAINNKD